MRGLVMAVQAQTTHQRGKPGFGDILAGISVATIVIPQSLAYAELAGMPVHTGLYAAAMPSIAAAFFVSSPYLQTGPTAMTALLALGTLSQLASPGTASYIGMAALLAIVVGIVRVLVGLARFGSVAYLMSQPVLMGFTSAAAILICASQLPTVFGVHTSGDGVLLGAIWTLTHPHDWQLTALGLAIMTGICILLGRKLHPLFPGVLLAVGLGIGYSLLTGYQGSKVGEISTSLPKITLDLPWLSVPSLLIGGTAIALVGFAEVASIARTYATQDRMRWDANREFISQGIANLTAGLFGAFPVGGSFGRSSINRLAGAKTCWSGAATGLVVLAFFPFMSILSALPKAILGAIVITAVLNLIRPMQLIRLRRYSHPQASIAWLTFGLTLALAPRIDIAVLLGIGLAVAQHLRREQQLVFEHWLSQNGDNVLHFKPLGVLWFGSIASFQAEFTTLLAENPDVREVSIHLGGLGRIDLSAAIILRQLMDDARRAGLKIELSDVPPMARSWVVRIWQEGTEENEG
jgi:SulP family sulfate permease